MKPIPLVFLAAMASTPLVFSQEEISPTTAHILGDVPDGTPPPAEPVKPGFVVPEEDILQTETHYQGGREITVQKITPIELPMPPVVAAPPEETANPATPQPVTETGESQQASGFIFVGANVFHPKDSAPRTLVNFSPQGQGAEITFWSSADFAYLSGFSSFVGSDGIERSLMMSWGQQEIEHLSDLTTESGVAACGVPEMPALPAGKATFSIASGQPSPETLTAIQSLHDLYNNEYNRLKTAYEGRERARLANEAELKAHPPKPKDLIINYWRIEAPQPAAPETPTEGAAK
jgi:hypothetical protein